MPNRFVLQFVRDYLAALGENERKIPNAVLLALIVSYDTTSIRRLGFRGRLPNPECIDYDSVLAALEKQNAPVLARVLCSKLGSMIRQTDFVRLAERVCEETADPKTIWRLSHAYMNRLLLDQEVSVPAKVIRVLLRSRNSEPLVCAFKLLFYSQCDENEIMHALSNALTCEKRKIRRHAFLSILNACRSKLSLRSAALKGFLVELVTTARLDEDVRDSAQEVLNYIQKQS